MKVSGSPRSPTARRRNAFLPTVWPENSASLIQKYPKTTMKAPMIKISVPTVLEPVTVAAAEAKKKTAIRIPATINRSRSCAIARVPRPATW